VASVSNLAVPSATKQANYDAKSLLALDRELNSNKLTKVVIGEYIKKLHINNYAVMLHSTADGKVSPWILRMEKHITSAYSTDNAADFHSRQAGRRLVRSLLIIYDIGVSLHPWPMWITELRITRYSAAYAKFEHRTKLVISKLQCNTALTESG